VLTVVGDIGNAIALQFGIPVPVASIQNIIGALIDAVVAVENALGRFTHATPTPVVAVNPAPIPVVENNTFDVMSGKSGVI
jgi:hypothetical protein